MNKFVAFSVLALAALGVATSSPVEDKFNEAEVAASLETMPEKETALLADANLEIFAPFCLSSRDFIHADLRSQAGSAASRGFSYFFSMADDVAKKALEVNMDATTRIGNQLANPSAEVEGDDEIAETQREVASQSQPKALMTAFTGAITATSNAFVTVLKEKASRIREFADIRVFLDLAKNGCTQVDEYEAEMHRLFKEFKDNLPEEQKAQVKDVRIEMVPCVTAKRISRVNGFCGLINSSYAPFIKVLGLTPNKMVKRTLEE